MADERLCVALEVLVVVGVCWCSGVLLPPDYTSKIRFLVTANTTYNPNYPNGSRDCMATVASPFLYNWRSINETTPVVVGGCDSGALVFDILNGTGGTAMNVSLTFNSDLFQYPNIPECTIPWNGSYVNPTADRMDLSPLPSCFSQVSDDNNTGYYWFRLLEWQL